MEIFNAYDQFEPVRLNAGGVYCSGTLISPDLEVHQQCTTDLVLTCAHFFRDIYGPGYNASSQRFGDRARRWSRRVHAVRIIDGTDIAVVRLSKPVTGPTPRIAHGPAWIASRITTIGFGGNRSHADTRRGRFLFPLPLAYSANFLTRVRHAGVAFNMPRAIKGDSGGPVFFRGAVIGTQALVFDPKGKNLGFATIALTAPHRAAIQAACAAITQV